MDLSIVIPVKDDIRIKQCIDSIDENVEVVVVLNDPSKEVEEIVSEIGENLNVVKIDEANLSKAYNYGILNAKYENIFLMDSDCIFSRGCIKKLYDGLSNSDLAKGKVVFKKNSKISNIIAKVREFTTSDFCNAYSPPLAFKKDIVNKIGYYFDPDLRWEEDYEFNLRVKKNKLSINWIQEAEIYHPELTLYRDLKSAYNYGTGHYIGIVKGIYKKNNLPYNVKRRMKKIQKEYILKNKGRDALFYYNIWSLAYKAGIFGQKYLKKTSLGRKL